MSKPMDSIAETPEDMGDSEADDDRDQNHCVLEWTHSLDSPGFCLSFRLETGRCGIGGKYFVEHLNSNGRDGFTL